MTTRRRERIGRNAGDHRKVDIYLVLNSRETADLGEHDWLSILFYYFGHMIASNLNKPKSVHLILVKLDFI